MSADKFQNKYRIKSARAMWHDYNHGAYFVTICTQKRKHFFGYIESSVIHLSKIGKYAYENIIGITAHYPYVQIPFFVVMPDHIHLVVIVDGTNKTDDYQNNCESAETLRATIIMPIPSIIIMPIPSIIIMHNHSWI